MTRRLAGSFARPLLALLALVLFVGACGDTQTRGVRVVLVSLDTLRNDRFDARRMPRLHAAAEEGLVYERFHATSSVTLPSHITMFTGLHPWEHGVLRNGVVASEDLSTAAERLVDAGFDTAAVVASFPLHRTFRCDQGFARYLDEFQQASDKDTWNGQEVPGALFSSRADTIVEQAFTLLDGMQGDKQFLFAHFFDPHAPYGDSVEGGPDGPRSMELSKLLTAARNQTPKLPTLISRAEALYDLDVAYLDEQLGRLLERLAVDSERFETHVIITADHGESFGEDGSLGHGKRLTTGQVHVPCVVLSPRVSAGRRDGLAGSVDVLPTLLAMAGLDADNALPGRDLTGPPVTDAKAVGMRSVFEGHQRDIRTDGRSLPVDDLRFYVAWDDGLAAGNAERVDALAGTLDDALATDLRRLFGGFESEVRERMRDMVESADPETREALKALGYLR